MTDMFPRIALVLSHLLANSTVHGPAKSECERLIEELRELDRSIEEIVSDRVRAAVEAVEGRMDAQEEHARGVGSIVYSKALEDTVLATTTSTEEHEVLTAAFGKGASYRPQLDHDKNGANGGSEPAEPTDDIEAMTVAQLKGALDKAEAGYPADAKKADLKKLLLKAREGPAETETTDPVAEVAPAE